MKDKRALTGWMVVVLVVLLVVVLGSGELPRHPRRAVSDAWVDGAGARRDETGHDHHGANE